MPRGDHATLNGTIPGKAIVSIATSAGGPNPVCSSHRQLTTCTEQVEACPLPAGVWQFRLNKLAGTGGAIRVQFLVD